MVPVIGKQHSEPSNLTCVNPTSLEHQSGTNFHKEDPFTPTCSHGFICLAYRDQKEIKSFQMNLTMIYCKIEVVEWLCSASAVSLYRVYVHGINQNRNIENETNTIGCRQEQTNSRKADGALYILSL